MDPQETWSQLVDAYANSSWPEARDAATALLNWLDRRGFPPKTMRPDLGPAWDRAVARAACRFVLAKARRCG